MSLRESKSAGGFVAGDLAEAMDLRPRQVVRRRTGRCEFARPVMGISSEDACSECCVEVHVLPMHEVYRTPTTLARHVFPVLVS